MKNNDIKKSNNAKTYSQRLTHEKSVSRLAIALKALKIPVKDKYKK